MKKSLILFLLISLFTTYSFSQRVHSHIQLFDQNKKIRYNTYKSERKYLLDSTLVNYQFKSSERADEKSHVTYNNDFNRISRVLKYQGSSLSAYRLYKYGSDDVNCDDGLIIKYFDVFYNGEEYENTRETFEYTAESCDMLHSFARQLYNSSVQAWENNRKKVYYYNDNGSIDYIQTQYEGSWENLFKEEYLYHENGLLDRIYRVQNTATENDSLLRTSYYYNDKNQITSIVEEYYVAPNVWEYNNRALFTYDENGNVIEKLNQTGFSGAWEDNFRYIFEYDNQINIEDIYVSYDYELAMVDFLFNNLRHPLTEVNVQMKDSEGWMDASIWSYYYSKNPAISVEEPEEAKANVSIFPNPATDKLFISADKVSKDAKVYIYNTTGALVFSTSVYHKNSIDVSDLPKGFYTVNIVQNNESNVTKLIIQ